MDKLLLDFVGVGLVLFADTRDDAPRLHASASGRELVRRCLNAGTTGLDGIVQRVAAATWIGLGAEPPRDPAKALKTAAKLLQRHPPTKAMLAVARSLRCGADGRCDAVSAAVARLTETVATSALIEGSLDHAGLSLADARTTLAALFAALIAEADAIGAVSTGIVAAARIRDGKYARDEIEAWHSDTVDEHVSRLARDLGLPQALLDALVDAQRACGLGEDRIAASADEMAASVIETLDTLRRLSDLVGADEALEADLHEVSRTIREGRLGEAEFALERLYSSLDQPSPLRLPVHVHELHVGTICCCARLAGHLCEWRRAATLYRAAGRACAADDRLRRWRLKLAEGRALVRLADLPGVAVSALTEAAQIFAEAGGITSERDAPLEWAEAHVGLGALLLKLGDRQCRPERFLAAALHFKPALEVLTKMRAMHGWARAQIGLAHALRGQGSFQGDVVTLGDAVFAYRAALGILTRGMTPELWYEASAALGETLVRIAEETGDHELLQEAIETLMPQAALDGEATEGTRAMTGLALGRGMLLLIDLEGGSADDDVMLREALALLENALRAPVEHLNALDRARAQRTRGTILARLARTAGSRTVLEQAIEANSRAAELYLVLENEPEAEQISREIEALTGELTSLEATDPAITGASEQPAGSEGKYAAF